MLDIWTPEIVVYSRFNKNRSSGIHCVVTIFKDKVISRVNVEYQNTVCNSVKKVECT